ncbi:hypothetical protein [Synechococcus phage S-EIVl]|nr:hypothetical protein [Synechococcus phage S-EIVl]
MTKLITPPEHLIFCWYQDWVDANVTWEVGKRFDRYDQLKYVANQAAIWGANQKLEDNA